MRNPLEQTFNVRITYRKGNGDLYFKSGDAAAAAVAKIKKDIQAAGYGSYITVADDYGNVEDFHSRDFVRATTSAPQTF